MLHPTAGTIRNVLTVSALALTVTPSLAAAPVADVAVPRLRVELKPDERQRKSLVEYLTDLSQLLKLHAGGVIRPRPGTKFRVVAVAYSSRVAQTDLTPCITAAGTRVRKGIVATNFLPLGTRIRVRGGDLDREYVVADRMSRRYNGKYVIDVWHVTREEALAFGKKLLEIEILGYLPKKDLVRTLPSVPIELLVRFLFARVGIPEERDCLTAG